MLVLDVQNAMKVYAGKHSAQTFRALNGVSFSMERGEFAAVMGPSGAGKTTLLNCVATIDELTGGRIVVCGKDVTRIREPQLSDFRRNCLGFIFQDYNLLDTLTVRDNIALPLVLSHGTPHKIDEAVGRAANDLSISDILGKYPYEISGGQRQRAAAARAFVNAPELILADEPTGALDSKSSRDLLTCMQRMNRMRQTSILMVTHDPYAASYTDRVLFIKDGELFMELDSDGDRRHFYERILKALAAMGGARA